MNRILRTLGGIVGGLCPISGAAHAQWTVTSLHPAGAIRSNAYDVHAGQQVGYASIGDWATWHAALWNGTAASFVDLHPVGAARSGAGSAYNGQQVGFAVFGNLEHAALWSGTAASMVDLHPPGALTSTANDIHDGRQVGTASFVINGTFVYHACMWSGTASSFVDIHPTGAENSYVAAIDGGRPVGTVQYPLGPDLAVLWDSTGGSWINLGPALPSAQAFGSSADQQVGESMFHAIVWSGSAESMVDLHPASGAVTSSAADVHSGRQVGWVDLVIGVDRMSQARLWHGSADSYDDLHAVLPPSFANSGAYGIWSDENYVYVAGVGVNPSNELVEALLWTRPIAPCPADTDGNSNVNVNDLLAVISGWGQCPGCPPAHCPGDIAPIGPPQGDCQVGVNDLLAVITSWGWCP